MITVNAIPGERISLGREGENLARRVVFSLGKFKDLYGDGYPQLLVQRPGESTPYPANIIVDEESATWEVTNADTQYNGINGKAELRWYVGETLVKSAIWTTIVQSALQEPRETPPEPYQNWMDDMLQVAAGAGKSEAEAKAAATAAEAAQRAAEKAQTDAETAKRSAENAQSNAETSRKAAETAAKNAAANAEAAGSSEENAARYSDNAYNSALVSGRAADNALNSETAAKQSVSEAKESADAAAKSAEEAKEAAGRIENIRVENETLYICGGKTWLI